MLVVGVGPVFGQEGEFFPHRAEEHLTAGGGEGRRVQGWEGRGGRWERGQAGGREGRQVGERAGVIPDSDPVRAVVRGHQCLQLISAHKVRGTLVDPLWDPLQEPHGDVPAITKGEGVGALNACRLQMAWAPQPPV